ncbi:MAG: hypothetical protein KJZ74_14205 [Gemmatimonadales bacterium]|nr:hypothetical protein [Gemmatimonadales bacterium]
MALRRVERTDGRARQGLCSQGTQFTQQDPIGIAGGANVYGFAGGDPVNFSDPFGRCPPEDNNLDDCQTDQKGDKKSQYCPAGTQGTPPNCASVKTGDAVAGSCPNVSGQEWDLGQAAINTSIASGVEEGFAITGTGVIPATGPNFLRAEGSLSAINGWPTGTSTLVHSHPSGYGISPGDVSMANSTGIRVVSAGVGTNRYGSAKRGSPAVSCNMPQRPE